ncbi:hypothetical protein COCC4DRAFT_32875 [Bipolaris maydis ATCC 48331]|uniref:Uncharacterized protein n=2 Tax=Cochliobolus heterostrophus TaxID=5016 RepID=M2VAS4_COCH5|nr:uncharacterized protein COCC4DRAFT_32875 [Bipolaris maydis ATCC 48331]EMD96788.1 hypothetical protein COCHEDRAFT_1018561 [Bipolaris maydis C5]ENI03655.1 hypothetical protein COCC4DRAFT_32875 [Bipolaris maydis ATCC 48331]
MSDQTKVLHSTGGQHVLLPSRSIVHGELWCLPVGGSGVDAELKGQELDRWWDTVEGEKANAKVLAKKTVAMVAVYV